MLSGEFWNVCDAAQGVGSLFGGLAMLTTGIALLRDSAGPRPFAAAAVIAGVFALLTVGAVGTPIQRIVSIVYLPMIALTIRFRSWGGFVLLVPRSRSSNELDVA